MILGLFLYLPVVWAALLLAQCWDGSLLDLAQKLTVVSNLSDFIFSLIRAIGLILLGFGIFEPKHREARTGRNPRTKEAVEIPASTVPVFKAGKAFKEKVKG